MSKILEKIVAKRLTAHIEEQLLSNDVQSACMFIHTGPSGSNDTTSFKRKVHAFVTSSSSLMSPNNSTQYCVAHRPRVSPCRPAYKRFHSTETALLKINNDIICNMDNGKVTALTLLELSAALDTIDHSTLLERLYGPRAFK